MWRTTIRSSGMVSCSRSSGGRNSTWSVRQQDGRTALEEIRVLKPDVALLDVKMPGLDGHTVLRAVQRDGLPTAVVLLSATVLPPEAREGLAAGAMAYLSKEVNRDAICDAVAAAARGDRLQVDVAEPVWERPLLSPRELEVLRMTAGGQSAPSIGRESAPQPRDRQDPSQERLREARRL